MDDCKYCETIKKKENLIYEDDTVAAVIPSKTATKGHIQILSKKHYCNLQEMDNNSAQHLFYASSFATTALFETLEPQGTNIIANTGSIMKKEGHFHINAIARRSDDGLNLMWTPKNLSEQEMKEAQSKIKDKCDLIGIKKKGKETVDLDSKKIEKIGSYQETEQHSENNSGRDENKKESLPADKKDHEKEDAEGKKEQKKDNESYLIKQLRRMP